MATFFIVGAGGFIGSVIRYLVGNTLVVNLIGSFLIGIALYLGEERLGETSFRFLVTGLLGGFTTYSAFSGESWIMIKDQNYGPAVIYIASTLIGGLTVCAIAYALSKYLLD